MKVRLIEIKTEMMELPDDRTFWEVPQALDPEDARAWLREGEEIPERAVEIKTVRYEARDVAYPTATGTMKRERFLVPVNENRIFDQLIEVREADIQACVSKRTKDIRGELDLLRDEVFSVIIPRARLQGAAQEQERIGKLPWWRRLFKKF